MVVTVTATCIIPSLLLDRDFLRDIYNLDGHRVSKIIYDTIIILMVILAMEDYPPSPAGPGVILLFPGFCVALVELYSNLVGTKITKRNSLMWEDLYNRLLLWFNRRLGIKRERMKR